MAGTRRKNRAHNLFRTFTKPSDRIGAFGAPVGVGNRLQGDAHVHFGDPNVTLPIRP